MDRKAEFQKKLKRFLELQDEYWHSEGVKLYRGAQGGHIMAYIFDTNFHELMFLIRRHFSLAESGQLGDFNNREPLHDYLKELTRHLHNYLSAAKSLAEQTRSFVRHFHSASEAIQVEYQEKVNEFFVESPVAAFTNRLRNISHIR